MDVSEQWDLDKLAEEATVDCYDDEEEEEEERIGFATMIQDHLALPFETVVLDVPVTVTEVDADRGDGITALCVRGAARQWVSVLDLPLPTPPPAGAEWIAAYGHWCGGSAGE